MKLFEITLFAIDLGAAAYLIYKWRTMRVAVQIAIVTFILMTLVSAVPGFVQGAEFIVQYFKSITWTAAPEKNPCLPGYVYDRKNDACLPSSSPKYPRNTT